MRLWQNYTTHVHHRNVFFTFQSKLKHQFLIQHSIDHGARDLKSQNALRCWRHVPRLYSVVVCTHCQYTFHFKQLVKVHVASDDPFKAVSCIWLHFWHCHFHTNSVWNYIWNNCLFYVSEMCLLCSPCLHVFGQKYSKNSNIATTKIFLCSTTAIIFNRAPLIIVNKWAPNQHTGMISEGSCDTEDLE